MPEELTFLLTSERDKEYSAHAYLKYDLLYPDSFLQNIFIDFLAKKTSINICHNVSLQLSVTWHIIKKLTPNYMLSAVHPLDLTIFFVFLLSTLIVGLSYGRRVRTIQDYALGGKDFATSTLVATIVATFSSGSLFFIGIENTYTSGLYFMLPFLGVSLQLWLNSLLVTRMGEFMHHLSIAEAMGSMYGRTVQILTAGSGVIARIGYMAIQFKIIARVIVMLFAIESNLATAVSAGIVILYSAFGGIKSVTFTDVLQFLTFSVIIPVLAVVVWGHLEDSSYPTAILTNNPNFNLKGVIGWHSKSLPLLSLFLYCSIPHFQPELFQRISMAKNTRQASYAFRYSAGILLLVYLTIYWIGVLVLVSKPGLAKDQIVVHMVNQYASPGLKGLLGVGIIAMAMSTADSSLNAISVMFAHDVVKPLTGKAMSSVLVARLFSVASGLAALFMALYNQDLLKLVLLSVSFYLPLFTVPMLLAVLGFRTSKRAVLLSMASGALTVVLWRSLSTDVNSAVPGMLANLLVLFGSHYLLGEPGGWQKKEPNSSRATHRKAPPSPLQVIRKSRIYHYLQQALPAQEGIYTLVGCYAMAATYIGFYTIDHATVACYRSLYEGAYQIVLVAISILVTFPVWPSEIKSERFITFFWPLSIAAIFFFVGMLLVIMNYFHPMQIMVLMINLLVVSLVIGVPLTITLAISSISLAIWFFMYYTGEAVPWGEVGSFQIRMVYSLLLFTSFLIGLFSFQNSLRQSNRKSENLTSLGQKNKTYRLQSALKNGEALQEAKEGSVEYLIHMVKNLKTLSLKGSFAEKLHKIEEELIPVAFQLQGINVRVQNYLRLKVASFSIQQWLAQVQTKLKEKGRNSISLRLNTQYQTLMGDCNQLVGLLTKSITALQDASDEELGEIPSVLVTLDDTKISYPLPDVAKDHIKYLPGLRIVVTTEDSLPPLATSYETNFGSTAVDPSSISWGMGQLANDRILKAHYSYSALSPTTLVYVLPINVREVRPKNMDKSYLELESAPKRANDHFIDKEKGIDAQAQERAFLAAVAEQSQANIGLVKIALELIKWYHGPTERYSGEPFYLHPLSVAHIVLDYNQDEAAIIGSLLHDTIEDTSILIQQIAMVFGQETAEVVDLVTHLQRTPGSLQKVKLSAEEHLKMLERIGNKRGLYVKLADRMHNMRTIEGHNSVAKQKQIAAETLKFFVPVAQQLGLQEAAEEFEKYCLAVLQKFKQ